MAIWNFLKDGAPIGTPFDDGSTLIPGEDGFSNKDALDKASALGKGIIPDYAGNPFTYGDTE